MVGAPKQLNDPTLFHRMSLIPVLAWIGLGADGLSSSSYGPEEAFRALGSHTYLAILLGLATAITVFIISYAYARIIEVFPHGGGGYMVATHMLGQRAGVISGCALLVDYILTITVSIASCADALFSYLPLHLHHYKVPFACLMALMLIILNIRGLKESIYVMAPIFIVFVIMHLTMLLDGVITHRDRFGPLAEEFRRGLDYDLSTMGFVGIASFSSAPTPWGAGPIPVSKLFPTACRSCASRESRPASGPCFTWPHPLLLPQQRCSSAMHF